MGTAQIRFCIVRHPASHIKICLAVIHILARIPGVVVDLMPPEPITRRLLHSLAAGLSEKIRLVDFQVR